MTITGKHTKFGMEAWYLVPGKILLSLLPERLSLYTRFGFGTVVVGVWNHSDAYVDDMSYGPVLEAWSTIAITHQGKIYGYMLGTFNNNPSYAEPVNSIFKFTKLPAEIDWKERNRTHHITVEQNGNLILGFSGRPTFISKAIPFSNPRLCWLIRNSAHYVAEMSISAQKSRLAFTSVTIPQNGTWEKLADVIKSGIKFSIFYENANIKIPLPRKV